MIFGPGTQPAENGLVILNILPGLPIGQKLWVLLKIHSGLSFGPESRVETGKKKKVLCGFGRAGRRCKRLKV